MYENAPRRQFANRPIEPFRLLKRRDDRAGSRRKAVDELREFIELFHEQGAKWFAEGLSREGALKRFAKQQADQIAALKPKVEAVEAARAIVAAEGSRGVCVESNEAADAEPLARLVRFSKTPTFCKR